MVDTINQRITVNANDLRTVACTCGKFVFDTVVILKIVPSLYSQNGKPSLLPVQCMRCVSCGAVHMVEEILKSLDEEKMVLG
jgi:hypothetical protein